MGIYPSSWIIQLTDCTKKHPSLLSLLLTNTLNLCPTLAINKPSLVISCGAPTNPCVSWTSLEIRCVKHMP